MMDIPRVQVKNPVGIATDPNPSDLPPHVWTGGRNVSFRNGRALRAQGHSKVFGTPPVTPRYLFPYLNQNTPFWFGASATHLHYTAGTVWTDVSRTVGGAYNCTFDYPWNACFLNGVVVMNNGFDLPQSFQPNSSTFINLPNWPLTYRAKIVRSYKNYLVALNLTNNSVDQPTTVAWSSPADPGEVPAKWTTTDATSESGKAFLADTPGAIVDGIKLRDSLIIYKEDSVYSMRHIGGVFIFQFQQLFDDVGMLAPNCAAEFDGKHFVVGQGDVYVHNGVQKSSVIDGAMKDYLYGAIRSAGVKNVFVVPDYRNTEMWICFQASGAAGERGYCDQALIWNWKENHWTIRDLPNVIGGATGIVDPKAPDNWDIDTQIWDQDSTVWGSSTYNPSRNKIVLTSYVNNTHYVVGDSTDFDGVSFTSYLEKTDIYMDDDLKYKNLNSVVPHVSGGGVMKIRVGASPLQDNPVTWGSYKPLNIGVDYKVDTRINGRYLAVRFEMTSDKAWEFNGYSLEFTAPIGKR